MVIDFLNSKYGKQFQQLPGLKILVNENENIFFYKDEKVLMIFPKTGYIRRGKQDEKRISPLIPKQDPFTSKKRLREAFECVLVRFYKKDLNQHLDLLKSKCHWDTLTTLKILENKDLTKKELKNIFNYFLNKDSSSLILREIFKNKKFDKKEIYEKTLILYKLNKHQENKIYKVIKRYLWDSFMTYVFNHHPDLLPLK